MFHRGSRTLLLTDAVVFVPQDAPEIVPRPQLSTAGALPWCVLRCLDVVPVLTSTCMHVHQGFRMLVEVTFPCARTAGRTSAW